MMVTYTSGFFANTRCLRLSGMELNFGHFVCNLREVFLVIIIGMIYNALVCGDFFFQCNLERFKNIYITPAYKNVKKTQLT